jgi:hypothetical protein
MIDPAANFAYGVVTTAPSPADTGTTLSISETEAANYPDPASVGEYNVVVWPDGEKPLSSNAEIVRFTAKAAASGGEVEFTIEREQEDTSARSIIVGDQLIIAITKKFRDDVFAYFRSDSWIINETPSGTVNGTNDEFTIAYAPVTDSLMLYRDGQLLKAGGADYTLSGTTVTFVTAPLTGSVLLATYRKNVTAAGNADTVDGYNANATPTANNIPVLDSDAILPTAIYAPRGFLINGKIVPTVASNNLTVAIKGLDGNDPSATNPVYCRIGDTIRAITSALSVTKNAGTNWFNAGSTELATEEIDYFVYLGYNATDGVVIGFSRIPYANEYDDFSTTTTNEKYCAISTITTAAAGDDYEVVGRFAATLSAGAGYTWSVPTFTNKNLIQRPIFETRWLQWLPTYTGSGSMTYTSVTTVHANYKLQNDTITIILASNGTTGGSAHSDLSATLPFTAESTTVAPAVGCRTQDGGGILLGTGQINASALNNIIVRKHDSSNYGLGATRIMGIAGYLYRLKF